MAIIVKILRLPLAVYFMALFTVVLPMHDHDDHERHDHCTICLLCDQAVVLSVTTLLVCTAFLLIGVPAVFFLSIKHALLFVYPTRAPPAANFS